MKNIILLFLIFFSSNIYAQADFRKGKIIELNGDSLYGELNFQGDIANSKEIRFRNQDLDSIYRPFEIGSYSFENGKCYTSKIAITNKDTVKIFAEYLVNGKKDIFFHRSISGFHYSISVSDTVIKEISATIETVNIDGVNYQKESKQYIGYLKAYFNDCPPLFSKIDQLKSPERKSLTSLTKEYNDITCGEGKCIIYERKKYPLRIAIEPIYSYYLKNIFSNDSSLNAFGLHMYFWIPNSSERLYIKTGLHYSQLPTFNYFQIPLQFEYTYPFKIIKPKFDIGINMHIVSDGGKALTTLVSGGCTIKLTNSIYLDFDVSSDLFAFNMESDIFLSFAARTGLYININNKNTR